MTGLSDWTWRNSGKGAQWEESPGKDILWRQKAAFELQQQKGGKPHQKEEDLGDKSMLSGQES